MSHGLSEAISPFTILFSFLIIAGFLLLLIRFLPARKVGQPQIQPSSSGPISYGRVSQKTYELYSSHVRNVTGPVLSYLPLSISKEVRDWTIKKTLELLFLDMLKNSNSSPLSQVDVSDLGSFAELAFNLASAGDDLTGAEQEAIYRAVLSSLHQDWLENWNA